MPANALLQTCNGMFQEGRDFPTVWREAIRPHRLVAGIPIGGFEDGAPILKIPLVNGQRLVLRDDGYVLE